MVCFFVGGFHIFTSFHVFFGAGLNPGCWKFTMNASQALALGGHKDLFQVQGWHMRVRRHHRHHLRWVLEMFFWLSLGKKHLRSDVFLCVCPSFSLAFSI